MVGASPYARKRPLKDLGVNSFKIDPDDNGSVFLSEWWEEGGNGSVFSRVGM